MTATTKTLPSGAFAVLTVMSALAFVGNFLVLLIVIMRSFKKFANSTNALIGNLAVSDLVYSGISMPLTLAASTIGQSWTLGNPGCKLVMFLPNFCIAASILTMIAIAHDRRVAVINSKPQFSTSHEIIAANGAIWILSLILAAPALYEYSVYEKEYYASGSGEIKDESGSNEIIDFGSGFNPNDTYLACGSHGIAEDFEKVYATILFVLAYLLPLLIISGNYLLIWLFIRRKAKEISANLENGVSGGGGGAISKGKSKILKMLLMVVFVFAVAWAPYFAIFVREEVTGADDTALWGSIQHVVKLIMAIGSSLLNPIIYAAFNAKYREGFKAILSCRCGDIASNRVGASTMTEESRTDANS
ncbi:QRFP-like peptide receptor [Amphiura filiformis]|uniref:QRFP-like peptide receptor n=1 Tax=Amphiura filiformis TaxID=82378 RepID=UPI003B228885